MLHLEAIDAETYDLLKYLQRFKPFKEMRLVGGTSLALQIGHRKSIDIDLFGNYNASAKDIENYLEKYGEVKVIRNTAAIKIYFINNIKVDVVKYKYPWISDRLSEDGVILSSLKDISAMKLSAITGRGSKKDFIDLYFLLSHFSLEEMMKFHEEKYSDGSTFLVTKSLSYFADAEDDDMPTMFENTTWEEVKEKISEEHGKYVRG